jgi:hypothetical protein
MRPSAASRSDRMSASVTVFPTGPMERNVKRHFEELFARMRELGITDEQANALLIQSLKDIGAVEVNGVWTVPEHPQRQGDA